MHQPARTLTAASTREWIPIDVAVQRSGLAARTWRDRAVKLASQGLAMQAPPSGGVGKPVWWFDPRCDVRLAAAGEAARARRTTEALSGVYPIHDVRRAERKLHYINTWESACRNAPRGTTREAVAAEIVDDARREEGDTFRISVRSLYAWSRAYKAHGLEGLIDRGRSVATLGRPAKRSDDAVAFFYGLYHTQQKFTVVQCHEATQREAQRKRWSWAPSLSATIDWLRRHDDAGTTLLMRKGHAAWRHAVMPYMEQDYAGVAPGRMYVCDHHQVKYFVQHKGKAIRPWLTAVMDCRTRVLVGYHLGPAPHIDAIMQSLHMAFTGWGLPEIVKIDNGKDYASEALVGMTKSRMREFRTAYGVGWQEALRTDMVRLECRDYWFGILPELGCEVRFARPYEPQSKHIERWFGTFTDGHSRTQPGFCDTTPDRKPEALKIVTADPGNLPTLDEERQAIADYLVLYHNQAHFGDGMNGRSPVEVWTAELSVARVADGESLGLMVSMRGTYTVRANGVRVKIGGQVVGYGQYNSALKAMHGRKVLVAVSPDNIDEAKIFTPERDSRQLVCTASRNARFSPTGDGHTAQELRDAHAKLTRAKRTAEKAQREAPTRMRTAAEIMERQRRERAAALRATGTEGKPARHPDEALKLVQTGIDLGSIRHAPPADSGPPGVPFDPMDLVDQTVADTCRETEDVDPFELVEGDTTTGDDADVVDPMELVDEGECDAKDRDVFDPFELVDTEPDGALAGDTNDHEGEPWQATNATRC